MATKKRVTKGKAPCATTTIKDVHMTINASVSPEHATAVTSIAKALEEQANAAYALALSLRPQDVTGIMVEAPGEASGIEV